MALDIVRGTSTKPAASRALVEALQNATSLSGRVFIGFPIIPTATGPQAVDALWISEEKGIVIFDLVEGADLGPYQERQDDAYNAIDRRLRLDRRLVDRREVRIPFNTVSFAPQCAGAEQGDYPVIGSADVAKRLSALANWSNSCRDTYKAALSTLQNVTTIRSSTRGRKPAAPRASIIRTLDDRIKILDTMQSTSVYETTDGVQRIRGLAGSGKTIVLAHKAAYLHARHPEWRIAITYYTRSLQGTFERLVRDAQIHQTGEEPDWSCLGVMGAWGGIYSEFCQSNGIDYLSLDDARRISKADPFSAACQKALADAKRPKPLYDAILVDEAQDLPPAFLRLCYALLSEPKRLVYAYDELQRLSGEPMPSPEGIFGKKNGQPHVRLGPGQDRVLNTCYRNSRPILLTAHAIGFGIYRRPNRAEHSYPLGLVQMFDQAGLWRDVGYSVEGTLEDGENVVLRRGPKASPPFLEEHSPIDDLVQFSVFRSEDEQAQWVVEGIARNLDQDGLSHSDIVVINPDPRTTRKKIGTIRRRLLERGIECHIAGVTTDKDTFFITDPGHPSVTLSGVPRARGNEAAMVYVVNAEAGIAETYNAASVRNRLFAAITRSKAWIRVAGVGPAMAELKREYETLRENDFQLRFRYPTAEERAKIRTIHRDLSPQQQDQQRRRNTLLKDIIRDIQRGEFSLDDIDPDLRDQLTSILGENSDPAQHTHAD